MKPSIFTELPMGSDLQNWQSEQVAQNIMTILKRTGDKFRNLTWEEYVKERKKDDNFSEKEKPYFDKVLTYCESEERARKFSPVWNEAYINQLKTS